jgi:NhaP-type Na+/H+ and K+/H+ antiporter
MPDRLYLPLGSLAVPSELLGVAPAGIVIGLFLAFMARPVSVALCLLALCLLPFRSSHRGLRPIRERASCRPARFQ